MSYIDWGILWTLEEQRQIEVKELTAQIKLLDEQIDARRKALLVLIEKRSHISKALERLRSHQSHHKTTPESVHTCPECRADMAYISPKYQELQLVCPTCMYGQMKALTRHIAQQQEQPEDPCEVPDPADAPTPAYASTHPDAVVPEKLIDVFRKYDFPCMHINHLIRPES